MAPATAAPHGFNAWVEAHDGPSVVGGPAPTASRWVVAGDVAFALALIFALAAPAFIFPKADAFGWRTSVLGILALGWFVWGLQPIRGTPEPYGVARWPGLTALVCGTAAAAAYLAHGRRGYVILFVAWAVPGLVLLINYRLAERAVQDAQTERDFWPDDKYEDDPAWYASDWKPDPSNPDDQIGTDGYRLEMLGGPLAGRKARLRDSSGLLWVVELADGSLALRATVARPADLPAGSRLLGSYEFSHADEAMIWIAAQ